MNVCSYSMEKILYEILLFIRYILGVIQISADAVLSHFSPPPTSDRERKLCHFLTLTMQSPPPLDLIKNYEIIKSLPKPY